MIDDFLGLLNQIQNQGMDSADILRNIVLIQQQSQERQLNNARIQAQQIEYSQQQAALKAEQNSFLATQQAKIQINNQISTNNSILDLKNSLTDYNISVYNNSVAALNAAIERDKAVTINTASQLAGETRSGLAGNNIIVNTGSASGLVKQNVEGVFNTAKETYADKLNKINSVLTNITNEQVQKQSNQLATENANIQLTNKFNGL